MPLGEIEVGTTESVPMAAVVGPVDPLQVTDELYRRMDVVWAHLHGGAGRPPGHTVFGHPGPAPAGGGWEIEVGVQVDRTFPDADPVVCRMTPAGRVATATWTGPYDQIAVAQHQVSAWCVEQGLERTGVTWEVYGDWAEDPAELVTDLYQALADPLAVPMPSRADVEALAGPLTDDEWAGCTAIMEREGGAGIEVTAPYLAFAVEQARTEEGEADGG